MTGAEITVGCDKCGRKPREGEEFRPCRWTTKEDDTTVAVGWLCPDCDDGRAGK